MRELLSSAAAAVLFTSCSGSLSTVQEGFAFRITEQQASGLVDSVIRGHVAGDRMLPGSRLVATGYDRSLTDTQTYTLSAIPVPSKQAFALEVTHEGTMFNGPTKAKRIFDSAIERASLLGPRVDL